MDTFLKIAIGFILGVACTFCSLLLIAAAQDTEENQLREDIRIETLKKMKNALGNSQEETEETEQKNIQWFELSTKKGVIKLHTYMSTDSVRASMGRPQLTDVEVRDFNDEVRETWKYKGRSEYGSEFTLEFVNGELISVDQSSY